MCCTVKVIYCMISFRTACSFPAERHVSPSALVGTIPLPCQGAGAPGTVDNVTAELQKITPELCPWLTNQDNEHFTPKSSPTPSAPSCLTLCSVIGLIKYSALVFIGRLWTPRWDTVFKFFSREVSVQWFTYTEMCDSICLIPELHRGEWRAGDSSWHVEAPQCLLRTRQVLPEIKFAQSLAWKWTNRKLQKSWNCSLNCKQIVFSLEQLCNN